MSSLTEPIELVDEVFAVIAIGAEAEFKVTMLLLEVHECSEERRNAMVEPFSEQCSRHHSLVASLFEFSFLDRVQFLVFSQGISSGLRCCTFHFLIVDKMAFSFAHSKVSTSTGR